MFVLNPMVAHKFKFNSWFLPVLGFKYQIQIKNIDIKNDYFDVFIPCTY